LPQPLSAGVPEQISLFFIRTYVYGLERLSSEQRATLREAIKHMSEPMLRYKGMLGHEARIVQLLSADTAATE
jgi:hypothetical protein